MADNYSYLNTEAAERATKDRFSKINGTLAKLAILQHLPSHEKIPKLVEVIREMITDILTLEGRIAELEEKIN